MSKYLVTGASGYIGGRLVPRLLDAGYRVRCLARSPRKLVHRPWAEDPRVEVIEGDADSPQCLRAAMSGCSSAFYLIHSMAAVGPSKLAQGSVFWTDNCWLAGSNSASRRWVPPISATRRGDCFMGAV